LTAVFDRLHDSWQADSLPGKLERVLIGSTFVLCGLRYQPDQIETLYRDLSMTLEDSTTYQLILNRGVAQGVAQGAIEEAQRIVLLLGTDRFGVHSEQVETTIRAIVDQNRLERMTRRIFHSTSWDDLLATP
jgi:predicted transposase YdaD